jgi:hypothetical protein
MHKAKAQNKTSNKKGKESSFSTIDRDKRHRILSQIVSNRISSGKAVPSQETFNQNLF